MSEPAGTARRRVRRGEGEVTQWPRGLVDYVPDRTPEETPSAEEDRLPHRLLLASRLISLLAARGIAVERELEDLRGAERALRAGDRPGATAAVEALLGRLDRRAGEADRPPNQPL